LSGLFLSALALLLLYAVVYAYFDLRQERRDDAIVTDCARLVMAKSDTKCADSPEVREALGRLAARRREQALQQEGQRRQRQANDENWEAIGRFFRQRPGTICETRRRDDGISETKCRWAIVQPD
jgi:hypothetical protein